MTNKPSVVGCTLWAGALFWVSACVGIAVLAPKLFLSLALITGGALVLISVAWVMGVLK